MSTSNEFCIPLSREELMRNDGRGSYAVKEVLSICEITNSIEDCQSMFAEGGPSYIEECFDTFYSVMHHFPNVAQTVRESFWSMLVEALTDSCRLFDNARINIKVKKNSCKMLVYCVAQFVDLFENQVCKPDTINAAVKRSRKTKKKGPSAVGSNNGGCSAMWEEERERIMVVLYQFLQQDLAQIFEPPACEGLEDVINLVSGCCYKLLENPAAMRNVDLKDSIFNLLGLIVKSHHQNFSVSVKLIQLLQNFEHAVQSLVHGVQIMVTKYNLNNLVGDIIREIGEKDPHDLSLDTSGTKSCASFVSEIAHTLPSQTKTCITFLFPHLNGESQTLRNGVLSAFGEIISQSLNSPDMLVEDRSLRDTLLDHLQSHILDISAHVRCKVLQVWLQLCEAKSIPLPRLKNLLVLVCDRLKDKSSLVRKSTLQLLTGLLKNNPFAASLDLEHFKKLLSVEAEKLRAMLPSEEEDVAAPQETGKEQVEQEVAGQEDECEQDERSGADQEDIGNNNDRDDENAHKVKVVKQMAKVQYFKDSVSFIEQIRSSVPLATQLLGSKVTSDVHEALEFVATAQEFDLPGAKEGVRKSLLLMSSSEQAIRDLVMNAYTRLYFSPSGNSPQECHSIVVCNLLSLVRGANIGELTSLEEMLLALMKAKRLPKSIIQMFWDVFAGKISWAKPKDVEYSLMILSMLAKADPSIVQRNLSLLLKYGFRSDNLIVARYSCQAIHCLADRSLQTRLPPTHSLFSQLTQTMVLSVSNDQTTQWIPFAEQAITAIYRLAERPDLVAEQIFTKICDKYFAEEATEKGNYLLPLSRLIALAGHVALSQMVFLETDIRSELKRRRGKHEDGEEAKRKEEDITMEDEMGLAGAAADDVEAEVIRRVCNEEICGSGMLGAILPIIITVLSQPKQYPSDRLQAAATLALSKYMIVSSKVCEEYLRLFFTLLETSPTPTVRANALIALGDLIVRFPNLIEPWTKNIYARLCDSELEVRQSAVTVLTHLILNDMVKVKGQLSEMALCLEDPVLKIANRVKLFFLELSRKGNALYNILPDIISRLSDPSNNVSKKKFRTIMSYLFSLIQKDKQCEGLIEKLCHRFRASRSEQQAQNLAFCLSLLSYSERGLRKLQENMPCYQPVLNDPDVYNSFLTIVGKLKTFAKPEVKLIVEELEFKLKEAHEKGKQSDPEEVVDPGSPVSINTQLCTANSTLTTPMPPKSKRKTRGTTQKKRVSRSTCKPLHDHNTPIPNLDDFKYNAVTSARRLNTKISEDSDEICLTPDLRMSTRKGGRRRLRVIIDEDDN